MMRVQSKASLQGASTWHCSNSLWKDACRLASSSLPALSIQHGADSHRQRRECLTDLPHAQQGKSRYDGHAVFAETI